MTQGTKVASQDTEWSEVRGKDAEHRSLLPWGLRVSLGVTLGPKGRLNTTKTLSSKDA